MANGVTPEALEAALAATPDARAAWIVSPTYYGMAADVAGCAAVCAGRRRPARRRPVVGLALRLPPRPAAVRAPAGRRRRADLDAQDRRLAHPVGDAPRRADRPHRPRRGRARDPARPQHVAVVAADGLARRGAPAARDPRPVAALAHDRRLGARPRGDRRDELPRRRRGARRASGRRRLGPAADRHRRARDRLQRLRGRGRPALGLRHPRRARHPRDDGARARPPPAGGGARVLRARLRDDGAPDRAPGRRRGARARLRRARQRGRGAAARGVPGPLGGGRGRRRRRARVGRVDRRLPAGHPRAAAGRADHRRGRSTTCASCGARARACTAPATPPSAPSSCSATSSDRARRPDRPRAGRGRRRRRRDDGRDGRARTRGRARRSPRRRRA